MDHESKGIFRNLIRIPDWIAMGRMFAGTLTFEKGVM